MKRKENRQVTPHLRIKGTHDCIACWKCVEACPRQVLGKVKVLWHRHVKVANAGACIGCGKCVAACPQSLFTLNHLEK